MAIINPAHVSWGQWFHAQATALQQSATRVADFVQENPFYAINCAASMAKLGYLCLTRGVVVTLKEVADTSILPLAIATLERVRIREENTVLRKILTTLIVINTLSTFSQPFTAWNVASHPVVFIFDGLNSFDRRPVLLG